ncbi:MAG: 16S rRNA (guanine(527)-N(7))-methyltransferase RsmG [Sphaerochaetaceae bacterium]|jgi:16S rRNA (guanine527-N7)-methyltransferase
MNSELSLLTQGAKALGFELQEKQLAQFAAYIEEVYLFNNLYSLVGEPREEFVVRHLLDSIAPLPIMMQKAKGALRWADVGSGAGLPGIPLAIMQEEIEIDLIERSGKRAAFLANAVAMCNLSSRVAVINKDLLAVKKRYSVVAFRAFKPLREIIEPIGSIVEPGGIICAYGGLAEPLQKELEAIEELGSWEGEIVPIEVPFLQAHRHLCLLQAKEERK